MNKYPHGRDFDRDKNLTYRPQDESMQIASLDQAQTLIDAEVDVVSIIRNQHALLMQSVRVLADKSLREKEKQKAAFDLVALWTAHAKAEENTVYDEMRSHKESGTLPDEGTEEHAIIELLVEEIEALNFRLNWSAQIEEKAKALAEVIENHIKDEEEVFLPLVKDTLPRDELVLLGREFQRQFKEISAHYKASLKPSVMVL
jgi:hemerythrin superfamily protein